MARPVAEAQRVAVGRGARGTAGADGAAAPGTFSTRIGWPSELSCVGEVRARVSVLRPPGRVDHRDRARRIDLLPEHCRSSPFGRQAPRPSPACSCHASAPMSAHLPSRSIHCSLMLADLMMGRHFSISALWWASRACGISCSRGGMCMAEVGEPLAHGRVGERGHNRIVELRADLLGRALGRPQAIPEGKAQSRGADLVDGGNMEAGEKRVLDITAKGLHLAAAVVRERLSMLPAATDGPAGDQILASPAHRRDRARTGSWCRSSSENTPHMCAPLPAPMVAADALSGLAFSQATSSLNRWRADRSSPR